MKSIVSFPKGTFAPLGVSILLTVVGLACCYLAVTQLWVLGFIGALMLTVAITLSGIEFDTDKKMYRDYTRFLFFKFGKWQSYQAFPYVALQAVTLAQRNTKLPGVALSTGEQQHQSTKIILLNPTHTQKIFVMYSNSANKTELVLGQLVNVLKLTRVEYQPPIGASRLKRKR